MFFSEKPHIYSEAREEKNKCDFGICTADQAQAQKSIPLVLVHVGKERLEMEINVFVVDDPGSRSHPFTSGCLAVETFQNYFVPLSPLMRYLLSFGFLRQSLSPRTLVNCPGFFLLCGHSSRGVFIHEFSFPHSSVPCGVTTEEITEITAEITESH